MGATTHSLRIGVGFPVAGSRTPRAFREQYHLENQMFKGVDTETLKALDVMAPN
jgi:hypothetical protein